MPLPQTSSFLLMREQDAVSALNTLQSNFSVIDAIRKSGQMINENSMPEMIEWCRRIGYEVWASPPSPVDSKDYTDRI